MPAIAANLSTSASARSICRSWPPNATRSAASAARAGRARSLSGSPSRLERFLYRLSVSDHRDRLVLKGGMLLSAFGQRRPTRDIDLLAKSTSHEPAAVAALVADIAVIDADDGVAYDTARSRPG